MRVSKRLVVGACLGVLSLGALLPLASAEDDAPALLLTVEATLDGRPLAGASVRYAPVEGPVLDGSAVEIGAWLPVYNALDAVGTSVGSRTDENGRTQLVVSSSTSWLVRVGDAPNAQTRLLERGRHADGDTIAFPLVSGEALVRLPHAPPAGWRLIAESSRDDVLEARLVSVARAKASESSLLQVVAGLGRRGAGLRWWHASRGQGAYATSGDVGFESLVEPHDMPRPTSLARVEGRVVAKDRAPLPEGSFIRVGGRVPPLETIPLAADGTFRALVSPPVAGRLSIGRDRMHVYAMLEGYEPSGPVDLVPT
ncbi:MAG: hypothetical protein AB7T63_13465 [Planctomycetota bacterium]